MRVLHLTKFYPPVFGGIETVTFDLAEGMNAIGVKADVLCCNTTRHTVSDIVDGDYEVTRAGSLGMAFSTSLSISLVRELYKARDSYDIIHIQLPNPMANLSLLFANPKAKIVLHWQSDVIKQTNLLRIFEPLQQWLLRRADAIIATTENYLADSRWLNQYKDKVYVIPLGTQDPSGIFSPSRVSEIQDIYHNKNIIFSLGRQIYYKGFEVLIRSASSLPENCVVVIGGEGELLAYHRDLVVKLGLSDRVFFIGKIPSEDLFSYHKAATVFCLPAVAKSEAYGMVMVEAMAMGIPVVATKLTGSGVPWVNQHDVTGLNVPPFDAVALGDALSKITSDVHLRNQFAFAARSRFENHFRASTMVTRVVELYQNILEQ